MANKFLDSTGVKHLWDKVKENYQIKGNYVTTDTTQTVSGTKTYTGNNIFKNNYFEIKAGSANDDSWIKLTNATDSGYYAFGIRRPYATYGLQMKYHPASGNDVYYNIWHAGNFTPSNYLTTSAAASTYLGISAKATSATVADSANSVAWSNVSGKPTNATTTTAGLMSATDKSNLDTLTNLLADNDSNTTVDTIREVLNVFNSYPEGTTIANALAGKLDNSSVVNNLTSTSTSSPLSAAQGKALNDKFGNYLPKSGGQLTGPVYFGNGTSPSSTSNYLSAGGGYSTGSGRKGLKIVALDQTDAQMGMGVDLTGGPYELSIATSRVSNSQSSKITFTTHTTETTAYKTLGTFTASGAENPVVTFNVNGTIQENGTALSSKYLGINSKASSATVADSANAVAWSNVSNKPSEFTPTTHGHASNNITVMTGYSKAGSASAIAATDTLNTAIGKLEKALDGKGTSNLTLGTTATTAAKGNHTHSEYMLSSGGGNVAFDEIEMLGSIYKVIGDGEVDEFLTMSVGDGRYATQSWVQSQGYKTTDTNTWRPVVNNLTSTATDQSLSAAQGKALNDKFGSYATTSSLSNYLPLSGGTLTSLLTLTHDKAQLQFRGGHASYDGVISYQSAGNEAMVFSTKNVVTSFMFVNGEDTVKNVSSNRWTALTPGLQIKNNKVSISKLIPDGTTPTYNLDVGGTTNSTSYTVDSKVTMQYDSNKKALKFVFA